MDQWETIFSYVEISALLTYWHGEFARKQFSLRKRPRLVPHAVKGLIYFIQIFFIYSNIFYLFKYFSRVPIHGGVALKLILIDYKYGRIWYQCKGNDMRIIITLIPNLKKIWSAEIANQKLLRRPSRNLPRTRLWKTQICDVISWATLSKADDVL